MPYVKIKIIVSTNIYGKDRIVVAGLRERKKEERKEKILAVALELFEQEGFETTTMEKIAVKADLAVGTLYNYYPSKVDLFFMIIYSESGQYFAELDDIILDQQTSRKGMDTILSFCNIYLESFSLYSKKVWRELFSLSLFGKDNCYKMIGNIDSQFCNKLHVLLLQMQEQGLFSHHIDIEAMVGAIYSILSNNVLFYIIEEDMTKEDMVTKLERQIQVILPTINQ